jgi:hypothetical protein
VRRGQRFKNRWDARGDASSVAEGTGVIVESGRAACRPGAAAYHELWIEQDFPRGGAATLDAFD